MNLHDYVKIIKEEEVKLINELVLNGGFNITDLIYMFDKESEMLISKVNESPKLIYNEIIDDYVKTAFEVSFLVPGMALGSKDARSGISLYVYNGKTRQNGEMINENTRFDLASFTKLFTVLEALKLAEEGKFDLDKLVSYYDNKYNLDISVEKMAKFYYELRTDGRLDENISFKELQRRLSSSKVICKNTFIYSDVPFIILKDIMPLADMNFKNYFNGIMGLQDTSYDGDFGSVTGSKNGEYVNDPKARVMEKYGIYPGHAGIFSTSKDLIRLFDFLNEGFLSHESVSKMITPIHDNPIILDKNSNIRYVNRAMGVYYKNPYGIKVNDMADVMSDEAFAIAGFTGTWAVFDLKNGLTANILGNPLSDDVIRSGNLKKLSEYFGGVKFESALKTIKVLDDEDNLVCQLPFSRVTNILKEKSIYTLLKLRLAKNVLMRRAMIEKSGVLLNAVKDDFEKVKVIKKK